MEFNKKKYSHKEVQLIFDAYRKEYEKRFDAYNQKIAEITKENNELRAQIMSASEKEQLILAVLKRAEKTALDLENQSNLEYELELERLKAFSEKWDTYFNKVKTKYPTSTGVKKAIKIKDTTKAKNKSAKQIIGEIDTMLDSSTSKSNKKVAKPTQQGKVFNPEQKIGEYIVATNSSGFNMDEVLNPGDIKLEDICKELGLIDEI